MDVGAIKDTESLEAWLQARPRGTEAERDEAHRWAVLIAHRAAMRALPVFWDWSLTDIAGNGDLTSLPLLRAVLIGGVAGTCPTPLIKGAALPAADASADAAALYAFSAADTTDAAAVSAHLAADAAAFSAAAAASAGFRAALPTASAAAADAAHSASAWDATREDCAGLLAGGPHDRRPLWPAENPLASLWSGTRRKTLAQGPGWHFWVDWYERALNGQPQDWDLLTKIALIDPEDWDKGADHVNALIADIRVKHLAETRPLGEDAIDKGADGLWHRVGRPDIDRDILQDACDRVAETVKRIRKSMKQGQRNALTALTDDLKLLEGVLRRYRDRPLRLHDTFLQVQRHIARDHASGELPDDHLVDDLRIDLGTAALDMRNACPMTAQVVAARASARFGALDERERTAIVQLAEAAASLSDEPLAAEFAEDAADATNPAAAPKDGVPAQYRLTTRLAKIFTHDGPNLVDALILMGAVKSGGEAFSAVAFAILALIL